jgi:hypothetical protein
MAHKEVDHNLSVTIGVFIALVAGAALFYNFVSKAEELVVVTDQSFAFGKLEIQSDKLDRERKSMQATISADNAQLVNDLQVAVRAANLAQLGGSKMSNPQHEVAVQFAADEAAVAVPDGYKNFVSLGDDLYHECLTAFAGVQSALESSAVTFDAASASVQPGFEVYAETCGNALPMLKQVGIVDEKGRWIDADSGPYMLELLNRLRFANIISLRKKPTLSLGDYEREILYRWRVANPAIPVLDRMRYIDTAETEVKGFPANEMRGNLYFQSGDFAKAAASYEIACAKHPADMQLKKYCAFLDNKIGTTVAAH